MNNIHYLCSVFFIVLDLRLTKVGVQRYSFFLCLEVKGIVDMVFLVAIVYSGYSIYSGCLFLLFYHFAIKILKSVAKNNYFC